jgi:hypothetical protein
MPKPEEAATPKIKFVTIACSDDGGLYALDVEGRVFWYIDDNDTDEHGWYQLEHDETRLLATGTDPEDE